MQTMACRGASQGWNMTNKDLILKDIPAIPSKTITESTRDRLYITRSVMSLCLRYFPLSILSAESLFSYPFLFLFIVFNFVELLVTKERLETNVEFWQEEGNNGSYSALSWECKVVSFHHIMQDFLGITDKLKCHVISPGCKPEDAPN